MQSRDWDKLYVLTDEGYLLEDFLREKTVKESKTKVWGRTDSAFRRGVILAGFHMWSPKPMSIRDSAYDWTKPQPALVRDFMWLVRNGYLRLASEEEKREHRYDYEDIERANRGEAHDLPCYRGWILRYDPSRPFRYSAEGPSKGAGAIQNVEANDLDSLRREILSANVENGKRGLWGDSLSRSTAERDLGEDEEKLKGG